MKAEDEGDGDEDLTGAGAEEPAQALRAWAALAGALFVAGALGPVCFADTELIVRLKRMGDEAGIPLPDLLELALRLRSGYLAPVAGVVGAAVVLVSARGGALRPLYLALGLGVAAVVLIHGLPTSPALGAALLAAAAVGVVVALPPRRRTEVLGAGFAALVAGLVLLSAKTVPPLPAAIAPEPEPDLEPGVAAEVADRVVQAVREGLARGVGTFTTPGGRQGRYVLLRLDGASAPAALPPYEQARADPGCAVLPWGPPANTRSAQELITRFPHAEPRGVAPAALDAAACGAPARWALDLADHATTEDGTPALRYPATFPAPGHAGYSVALTFKRARLDTAQAASEPPTRLTERDEFADELLEVKVHVFRGFDPARDSELLPRQNLPLRTFVLLVRP